MGLVAMVVVVSTLAAPDAWRASLPATLSQEQESAAIEVRGCRFSVGTAVETTGFPPLQHAWLKKEGCETGGYVILGTSYSTPSVLLDARKQGVVASFTFRATPSGSAFQQATLVSLDFDTGDVTHRATLAALPPFGTGLVQPTSLDLRGSGTVVVRGTKNGVMPGETGAGDEFIAVFDKFLKNSVFSPPPSSVVAF